MRACYPRGLMRFPNTLSAWAFATTVGLMAADTVLLLPLSIRRRDSPSHR